MPASHIALEYGLTSTSLTQYCRSAGIAKPPRGFWQKVRSGMIPHPKGRKPRGLGRTSR